MSNAVARGLDLAGVVAQQGAANGLATLDANSLLLAAQTPDSVPRWRKTTTTFAALAAAALTNHIEVFSLPAGGVIHAVKIKHSASFTGGAIASYTVSVGVAGDLTKYASAFNVFQAPGDQTFQLSDSIGSEDHANVASIRIAAVSTGANLDQATTGSVDVWLLVSKAV